ncbi:hypothetical protein Scep_001848 [Stephania cephalantha]|uniref:Uncharacterized protein n=1 Tax=Stephania cephalantha TaxID=152367 RepID=A0AAP0Q3R7_9MAGN
MIAFSFLHYQRWFEVVGFTSFLHCPLLRLLDERYKGITHGFVDMLDATYLDETLDRRYPTSAAAARHISRISHTHDRLRELVSSIGRTLQGVINSSSLLFTFVLNMRQPHIVSITVRNLAVQRRARTRLKSLIIFFTILETQIEIVEALHEAIVDHLLIASSYLPRMCFVGIAEPDRGLLTGHEVRFEVCSIPTEIS